VETCRRGAVSLANQSRLTITGTKGEITRSRPSFSTARKNRSVISRADPAIDRRDDPLPCISGIWPVPTVLVDRQYLYDVTADGRATLVHRARDDHSNSRRERLRRRSAVPRLGSPRTAAEIIGAGRESFEGRSTIAHDAAHRIVRRPLRAPEIDARPDVVSRHVADDEHGVG